VAYDNGVNPRTVTQRAKRATRDKQEAVIRYLSKGYSVTEACTKVGITTQGFYYWCKHDAAYALAADRARGLESAPEPGARPDVPDFPQFCEQYLGLRLFHHHLQWFDALEGRPPRDLHPSMRYEPADPDLLVINCPPAHAKTTVISIAYSTWRIVRDPTVRIVLCSKSQRLAMQFLLTIKTYLTHPSYKRMQTAFGPPEGFAAAAARWRADMIYVGDAVRDTQEKDPTVQAIGVGGQLYGARCDLVVMDDIVDNMNAGDFEKQAHWIATEVVSRIPDGGKVLLVGTRLAAQDIYSEIRAPERYGGEGDSSPWTYLSQPAVLEYAERPEDWVALWPRADRPVNRMQKQGADGLYPRWDGPSLARRRRRMSPPAWERVYQQSQVGSDAVFSMEALLGAQAGYSAGLLPDMDLMAHGNTGRGRRGGMRGLRLIAGLDPAAAGFTAAALVGLDAATGIQWVLDCHNEQAMLPHAIKDLIRSWTAKYGISEWVVEKNGFQGFLSQDVELRSWVAANGGVVREHYTSHSNKMDSDMGVAGMSALFDSGLIKLPRSDQKPAVRQLVDQLSVWSPGMSKHIKSDLVMALWFASRRCSELVRLVTRQDMFDTGADWFQTRWDISNRHITESLEDEMRNMPQPSLWGAA
jgi:hypothetical protein